MNCHGAVIHAGNGQKDHHDDGQDGIKIIGNRSDKEIEPVAFVHIAGNSRCPGRNRGDNADRCCGGIDHIGKFCSGYLCIVRYRPHYRAHCQTVKIVINENDDTQSDGRQLDSCPAFDMLSCPESECRRPSRLVHEGYHNAQDHQEYQDTYIVGIRKNGYDSIIEYMEKRSFKIKIRVEEPSHKDSDEEGGVYLLGQQGQSDGDHRRQQCPGSGIKVTGHLRRFLLCSQNIHR